MTPLEQSILRTVAYFDMFSYPLTAWEIWKWGFGGAGEQYSYRAVEEELVKSPLLQQKLQQQSGLYFFKGRQDFVGIRQERYRLSLQKYKRARRYAAVLSHVPFVRAVAVCNSLAMSNARAESDIDLFIITAPDHVWTARLFAAGWAQLRKLRPQLGNRADKVCLSFFITQDVGDLSVVRNADDPYFTMWLASLASLFDPHELFEKLWQANSWLAGELPNAAPRAVAEQRRVQASFVQPVLEALVASAWFERWAERFQRRRLPQNLRALANTDTRVVLNQRMLKFHDNDRRDYYAKQFHQQCARLGV